MATFQEFEHLEVIEEGEEKSELLGKGNFEMGTTSVMQESFCIIDGVRDVTKLIRVAAPEVYHQIKKALEEKAAEECAQRYEKAS